MLLTNNSEARWRETETITTDASVIPNVINTYAVDGQLRQWRVFLVNWNRVYSKNHKLLLNHANAIAISATFILKYIYNI